MTPCCDQSGSLELTFSHQHSYSRPGLSLSIPGLPSSVSGSQCASSSVSCLTLPGIWHLMRPGAALLLEDGYYLKWAGGGCPYHPPPGARWSWIGKDQFHGENPRRHKHQKLVFKPQIHKGPHVFTDWPCLFHIISKHMFTMEAAQSPSESVAISVRSGRGEEREKRVAWQACEVL